MRRPWYSAALVGGVLAVSCTPALAGDPPKGKGDKAAEAPAEEQARLINLLDGVRSGELAVEAEGRGDGRMTLAITNRTDKKLRVVLPPSLVAQGASGQFGGGGMGGGMGGGRGGMGGGMGGMGGGMGGMGGGGMGGGGMGGGGMGGGMGGGGMGGGGGGSMPASMGMMMLGRLIMQLVGDPESWDQNSLSMGMMGGMGGGMGGMGGGMGGMGGGGMGGGMGGMGGGMGGGFRSVPPTGLLNAEVKPGQTRKLPTSLVSLVPPVYGRKVALPGAGEPLQIGDASDMLADNALAQAALVRLASEKAPATVVQLVMWNVRVGLDWATIAKISKSWANPNEVALARHFVNRLTAANGELKANSGVLYVEYPESSTLADELKALLKGKAVLGLAIEEGVPARPEGPSLACRVKVVGDDAVVQVLTTDPASRDWVSAGKFSLPAARDAKGGIDAEKLLDAVAEGTLSRLVRVQLVKEKGKDKQGKSRFTIKIENASPLVLNGLALGGSAADAKVGTAASGLSLAPHKALTVPASADAVDRLGLSDGVKVLAADLSGL